MICICLLEDFFNKDNKKKEIQAGTRKRTARAQKSTIFDKL